MGSSTMTRSSGQGTLYRYPRLYRTALWALLSVGFRFMPRIKDLKDQQLYKVSRMTSYGPLDPVFRATVDVALIAEQWDQLVRIAASLRHRTAPADVVLKRLASGALRSAHER